VSECGPTVKAAVATVAFPPIRTLDPRTIAPYWKVTVPVAVDGETNAVNVIVSP